LGPSRRVRFLFIDSPGGRRQDATKPARQRYATRSGSKQEGMHRPQVNQAVHIGVEVRHLDHADPFG